MGSDLDGRIVRHLSEMGKKEIARSYNACVRNLRSAGGAGLIMAGTVTLKLVALPVSIAWVSVCAVRMLNYVLSFLLMQVAGFRLATKQAPLLGVSLGARWHDLAFGMRGVIRGSKLKEELFWIARTQVLSAVGNIVVVIPVAFLLHWLIGTLSGRAFVTPAEAREILHSLHPTNSASLLFAAFTGGLLWVCTWLGGVIGGRVRPFSKTVAAATFNIALGCLLGILPVIGNVFDLPIDVRHFVLSGGLVAASTASLGISAALAAGVLPAFFCVFLIGALNSLVSFLLAFLSSWISRGPTPKAQTVQWAMPSRILRDTFSQQPA